MNLKDANSIRPIMKTPFFLLLAALISAPANAEPPPGSPPPASAPTQDDYIPKNIEIRLEVLSMEMNAAADLARKGFSDVELYRTLLVLLEEGKVEQETLLALRCRSGERALVNELTEVIYPTEYFRPFSGRIPGGMESVSSPAAATISGGGRKPATGTAAATGGSTGSLSGGASAAGEGVAPGTPTAFETRNTGWTLETEAIMGGSYIDLRVAPNFTLLSGWTKAGQGPSETEMVTFDTQRIETAATMKAGVPFLLGTMNHSGVSPVASRNDGKIRFAFITAGAKAP